MRYAFQWVRSWFFLLQNLKKRPGNGLSVAPRGRVFSNRARGRWENK
jgi:hypothetical protein